MRRAFFLWLGGLLLGATTAGCRLIADIHDIELETDAGSPMADAKSDGAGDGALTADGDTGPCACSGCSVLANGQDLPIGLLLSGDTLYWVNFGSAVGASSIMSMPKTGGTPKQVTGGLTQAYGLQLHGDNFYWAALNAAGTQGLIEKMPVAGGAITTLTSGQPLPMGNIVEQGSPQFPTQQFLAVSDSTVYYTSWDSSGFPAYIFAVSTAGDGSPSYQFLDNVPKDGGATQISAYAMQLVGDSLFVISDDDFFDGILEVSTSTKTATILVSDLSYPVSLAVTDTSLLWCDDEGNFANGFVNIAPITGGSSFKSLGKGLAAPWVILTDSTYAYWINSGNESTNASIQKAPLDASSPAVTLVANRGGQSPQSMVMDDDFLYWVDSSCGGVVKAAK